MPLLLVVGPTVETARIQDVLAPSGLISNARFVVTIDDGLVAVREHSWDAVVIALPRDATEVTIPLDTFVDLAHGTPVIVVAGSVGEDTAAQFVRQGAADVVSYARIERLPEVVQRESRSKSHIAQFSDVTEQRLVELRIAESEKRFRSAFEHSGVGMLIVALDATIQQANARACSILGFSRDELGGKTMPDITHPEDIDATTQAICDLAAQRLKSVSLEKRYVQPSGKIVWTSCVADMVADDEGKPLHFVLVITDITARKEAEAERERLHAQLLQAQKMEALGILAGGVAHDFNNILAAILCSADVLMQDLRRIPDAGEMPEIVYELQTATQRGADLVKQILTFSRRASQRRAPIKLSAIAHETLGMLRKTVPANVDIQSTIQTRPTVLADATQIQQVITNLCTNAFHAMEQDGGTLTVDVDSLLVDATLVKEVTGLHEGPYARIRVIDTGPGMDAHTLQHIFEPFFTTKGAGKGTGLGMAVVHGIVSSHEGAIRVQSGLGKGTTIEVWLPAIPSDDTDPAKIKPQPVPRGQSEHIMLVDDEEGLARILGRLLQGIGYKVTAQQDSAAAIELFEKNPEHYQLALIDLHMPAPDGLEVARRMHLVRPELPIFIMSGYSDALGDIPPEELGVVGVLQKPITREVLARELRNALDRPLVS